MYIKACENTQTQTDIHTYPVKSSRSTVRSSTLRIAFAQSFVKLQCNIASSPIRTFHKEQRIKEPITSHINNAYNITITLLLASLSKNLQKKYVLTFSLVVQRMKNKLTQQCWLVSHPFRWQWHQTVANRRLPVVHVVAIASIHPTQTINSYREFSKTKLKTENYSNRWSIGNRCQRCNIRLCRDVINHRSSRIKWSTHKLWPIIYQQKIWLLFLYSQLFQQTKQETKNKQKIPNTKSWIVGMLKSKMQIIDIIVIDELNDRSRLHCIKHHRQHTSLSTQHFKRIRSILNKLYILFLKVNKREERKKTYISKWNLSPTISTFDISSTTMHDNMFEILCQYKWHHFSLLSISTNVTHTIFQNWTKQK